MSYLVLTHQTPPLSTPCGSLSLIQDGSVSLVLLETGVQGQFHLFSVWHIKDAIQDSSEMSCSRSGFFCLNPSQHDGAQGTFYWLRPNEVS